MSEAAPAVEARARAAGARRADVRSYWLVFTIVVQLLHVDNRAIAAGAVVCFLGTSAVAQLRFRSVAIPKATTSGLLLLPCGLAFVIAALVLPSLGLFVVGALLGGC